MALTNRFQMLPCVLHVRLRSKLCIHKTVLKTLRFPSKLLEVRRVSTWALAVQNPASQTANATWVAICTFFRLGALCVQRKVATRVRTGNEHDVVAWGLVGRGN